MIIRTIILVGFVALISQGCANVGFGDSPPPATQELNQTSSEPPAIVGGACVAHQGTTCQKDSWQEKPGCGPNYGCAHFVGVYYNSTNGCEPNSAQSYVEYFYESGKDWVRSSNFPGQTQASSTTYRCTYVGFAQYDTFKGKTTGECVKAPGDGNTYSRVVAGNTCTHQASVKVAGTIACDGSCQ